MKSRLEREDMGDAPVATVNKLNIWVNVCSAASATRDDGVGDQRDGLFPLFHSTVRRDDEAQRYL